MQPRGLQRILNIMPVRTVSFADGEFYHIYNRGVEKRDIFLQSKDYKRFIKTLYYYQFKGPKPSLSKYTENGLNNLKFLPENKIIEVICYCLMPNHFHLLVRQLQENGISKFMGQLQNSFTKYFNTKHDRIGVLFQGPFKAVIMENDEQFIHVSRYIHLNPVVSGIVKKPENYQWSSYLEYLDISQGFCSKGEILGMFPSPQKYQDFVEDQIDYGTTLEILKHQLIEEV